MQHRKRFGRLRVHLGDLKKPGEIDFAKMLQENAPAEPEAAAEQHVAAVPDSLPAIRSDGIDGDDMSDEETVPANKKGKGGKNIFESIIAKWSSLSAPGAKGNDSEDEGDGEGGASDEYGSHESGFSLPLAQFFSNPVLLDSVQALLLHCNLVRTSLTVLHA